MAAAGPAEYIYTEIIGPIDNANARARTTANPYKITDLTDHDIIKLLKGVYKDIPDGHWVNDYAKIELPSGNRFYLKREKNQTK